MNINAIHKRARRNSGPTIGEIVYLCGHTKNYRAISAYGFAMVAGMSANVLCDQCEDKRHNDASRAAEELPQLRLAHTNAVRLRDARMAELGIDSVFDPRIADLQEDVLRTSATLSAAQRICD